VGRPLIPDVLMAIKNKQLLPISDLDRGFIHPRAPAQVLVSYYQAGRICDYITEKWGWDTILAMLTITPRHRYSDGNSQGIEDGAGGVRQAVLSPWSKRKPRRPSIAFPNGPTM
jgi:hypothetical protein